MFIKKQINMKKEINIGFTHIDNLPDDFNGWSVLERLETNISDEIFKGFDPKINGEICDKSTCEIVGFSKHEEDIETKINIECYCIKWVEKGRPSEPSIQRFMYIPRIKISEFIRKNKIKRILK